MDINIDPYLLSEPFRVSWYEVTLLIGLVISLLLIRKLAEGYRLEASRALRLALIALPGGLIGARLLHVIDSFDYYAANPVLAFQIWEGGFAQYGMILGWLGTALVVNASWVKLPSKRFLDLVTIPLLAGFAIGRAGCITYGCCYGSPTSLPWGVVFTHPDSLINRTAPELQGIPIHPVQFYEMVFFLVLAVILLRLRPHLRPIEGASFMVFLFAHSLERFLITFLRGDYAQLQRLGWLTQSQIIALLLLAVAVIWLAAYHRTRGRKREHPPESSDDVSP